MQCLLSLLFAKFHICDIGTLIFSVGIEVYVCITVTLCLCVYYSGCVSVCLCLCVYCNFCIYFAVSM